MKKKKNFWFDLIFFSSFFKIFFLLSSIVFRAININPLKTKQQAKHITGIIEFHQFRKHFLTKKKESDSIFKFEKNLVHIFLTQISSRTEFIAFCVYYYFFSNRLKPTCNNWDELDWINPLLFYQCCSFCFLYNFISIQYANLPLFIPF